MFSLKITLVCSDCGRRVDAERLCKSPQAASHIERVDRCFKCSLFVEKRECQTVTRKQD